MIKQKCSKPTAYGKKRVNVFKLEKRVKELEREVDIQSRINQKNIELNRMMNSEIDRIQYRLSVFSSAVNDKGFIGRALNHFWAYLRS